MLLFGLIFVVSAIQFIHVSDLHYDPIMDATKYDPETSCRGGSNKMLEEVRKVYRFIPKPTNPTYGVFYCDSNLNLINAAIAQTYRSCPNPGLILLTGDLAAHGLDKESEKNAISTIFKGFANRFPGVPIVYALGNNDVTPSYVVQCNDERFSIFYENLKDYIPESEKDAFLRHGSYLTYFKQFKLAVLSLDGMLFDKKVSDDDCGLFDYITSSFDEARKRGYKVLVLSHFPIGVSSYDCAEYLNQNKQQRLIQILTNNKDIITGSFFSHSHRPELKMTDSGVTGIVSPAISPLFGNCPGFRVVDFDVKSTTLTDYTDYFMEFVATAASGTPSWTDGFRATELYGIKDISAASLKQMHDTIASSTAAYTKYAMAASGVFDPLYREHECTITSETEDEHAKCVANSF